MTYECIEVRTEGGKVGIVTLNRPKQLNALSNQLMDELGAAVKAFDADEAIGWLLRALSCLGRFRVTMPTLPPSVRTSMHS